MKKKKQKQFIVLNNSISNNHYIFVSTVHCHIENDKQIQQRV